MNWHKSLGLALALLGSSVGAQADSLRDIYELALNSDPLLKVAEAQYRANLENEKLSRAALLPQVNASYEFNDTEAEQRQQFSELRFNHWSVWSNFDVFNN